jgi:peptidyl-dipeptidase Dcp
MNKPLLSVLSAAIVIGLSGCSDKPDATTTTPVAETVISAPSANADVSTSILMQDFQGPYEGVPAFDKMDLSGLTAAVEQGMVLQLAEIDAIATNPATPNFDNTFAAMERAGKALDNVFTYWGIWSSNMSSPEFREIQRKLSPKLSEFRSKISQNKALFERVKAIYEGAEYNTLNLEQQRIVKSSFEGFVRSGILLDEAGQKRTAEINKKLAELHTKFGNNVLNDEESYVTYISKDQLSGLPESCV